MVKWLDLPSELLASVAQSLCVHCSSNTRFNENAESKTLSHLSRTCKTLRDIVQPILHHVLRPEHRKFISMARTMVQRPDLARAVRWLRIPGTRQAYSTSGWDGFPEGVILSDAQTSFIIKERSQAVDSSDLYNPWFGLDNHILVRLEYLSVAVLNCAYNVEQLDIISDAKIKSKYMPVSLPRLVDFRFEFDRSYVCPGIHNMLWPANIIAVAPMLKAFLGSDINDIEHIQPNNENLTEVILEPCSMKPSGIQVIIDSAPNLTTFFYSCGYHRSTSRNEVMPRQLSQMLLARRQTLQYLHLKFQREFWNFYEHKYEEERLTSLVGFDALKALYIDGAAFMHPDDQHKRNLGNGLFTQLLPKSIAGITILNPWYGHHFYDSLEYLAAVGCEQFPHLVQVKVIYDLNEYSYGSRKIDCDRLDKIKLEFAANGSAFHYTKPILPLTIKFPDGS